MAEIITNNGNCIKYYSAPVNELRKQLYTISDVLSNDAEGYLPDYVVQPNQGQNWYKEGRGAIPACQLTLINTD